MNLQDWINKEKSLNYFINCDCLDLMATVPDKFFDLSIVDPPFFSGPNKANYYKGGNQKKYNNYRDISSWENPSQKYFNDMNYSFIFLMYSPYPYIKPARRSTPNRSLGYFDFMYIHVVINHARFF